MHAVVKICTKLSHIMGRIDHTVRSEENEAKDREELVTKTLTLMGQLEGKTEDSIKMLEKWMYLFY